MSKFIQFRGGQIAYNVKGKGRAIVFLHGFLENMHIWKSYMNSLSKYFKIICIDLPTHGKSSTYGYVNSMEEMAEAVKAVLDYLKLRKYIFVGHSMGGYVALAFGESYPDSILGIVMFHSTAQADSNDRKKSRKKMIALVKSQKEKILPALIKSLFNTEHKNYRQIIYGLQKQALKMEKRAIISSIEGMMIRKEREIVLKFAPYAVLYLIGEKDNILNVASQIMESKLAKLGSYVLLEDCGHMGMFEKEGKCMQEIKKFTRSL